MQMLSDDARRYIAAGDACMVPGTLLGTLAPHD